MEFCLWMWWRSFLYFSADTLSEPAQTWITIYSVIKTGISSYSTSLPLSHIPSAFSLLLLLIEILVKCRECIHKAFGNVFGVPLRVISLYKWLILFLNAYIDVFCIRMDLTSIYTRPFCGPSILLTHGHVFLNCI